MDPLTRWSTNLLDEYHVDYGVTLTLLHAWKIFSETPNVSKWEYQNLMIQEVKSLKDLCHRSAPRSTSESAKRGFNLNNLVDEEGDVRKVQQMARTKQNKKTWHYHPFHQPRQLRVVINRWFDDGWLQKPGILFNEALHWFWFDANKKALIVSFDLAKEDFKEIPQPDDTRYVWNMGCSLGIMDGRLCIFPYFDDDEDFPSCGTWVTKNYNVKPSWELLSKDCEMNDHAIHYILNNDTSRSTIMPAYSCDENIELSRSKEYIPCPIFVQTLVSPFVNNIRGPSHAKNNKSTANAGSVESNNCPPKSASTRVEYGTAYVQTQESITQLSVPATETTQRAKTIEADAAEPPKLKQQGRKRKVAKPSAPEPPFRIYHKNRGRS
nr:hypothetical protein [Tanacetum cinerariifolium]